MLGLETRVEQVGHRRRHRQEAVHQVAQLAAQAVVAAGGALDQGLEQQGAAGDGDTGALEDLARQAEQGLHDHPCHRRAGSPRRCRPRGTRMHQLRRDVPAQAARRHHHAHRQRQPGRVAPRLRRQRVQPGQQPRLGCPRAAAHHHPRPRADRVDRVDRGRRGGEEIELASHRAKDSAPPAAARAARAARAAGARGAPAPARDTAAGRGGSRCRAGRAAPGGCRPRAPPPCA